MDEKPIQRLLYIRNNFCPICKHRICSYRIVPMEISLKESKKSYICSCKVLYCEQCKMPMVNSDVSRSIRLNNGVEIDSFGWYKKATVSSIREKMYIKSKKKKQENRLVLGNYEIVRTPSTIFEIHKKIVQVNNHISVCQECSKRTSNAETTIPISIRSSVKIYGTYCYECKTFYVTDNRYRDILKDNKYAKGYTFNGKELWNYSIVEENKRKRKIIEQKKRELKNFRLSELRKTKEACVMVCAKFTDGTETDYIITNRSGITDRKRIFTYISFEGRELLSAAFAKKRRKKGILNGKEYTVTDSLTLKGTENHLPLCDYLSIKKDGGYSSSKSAVNEIVGILIYSNRYNIYEIMPATYNKVTGEYSTDISRYRSYLHDYGSPDVNIDFLGDLVSRQSGNLELREQSILRLYGYSVSTANNLSYAERQELLAELVDTEVLTVSRIVYLLDFFIKTHPYDKIAIIKWEEDKEFIQNYKVNPERFLTCDKIVRKR